KPRGRGGWRVGLEAGRLEVRSEGGWRGGLGASCPEAGGGGGWRGGLGAGRLEAGGGVEGWSRVEQSKQQIKKPKYVQISVESYSHLTGLEDQVKSLEEQVNGLEDEVKDLDEKLSAAQLERRTW
ncbi:hypothetical protein H5410_023492, partial [Solanum commersonii]